ncbi:NIF3-like protein 1 isoform X1 [Varroa destructor]|uniref:NIF3-like protein 1 n=2 Tax=Varroa destructor TaxID=109461 RepID=A0A7M7L2I3_VARDE|nr:NIF3-like protein 1 isoform X1 [Varroa destructor]
MSADVMSFRHSTDGRWYHSKSIPKSANYTANHQYSCIAPVKLAAAMELSKVVGFLRRFAPIELAETWDNVGLLLEPTVCRVQKVLLTNDLTESVVDEAVNSKANLIVSYHPLIFFPVKRICQDTWKSRIIVRCLENRIAVYSPHTSWDHVHGGVNDWLAKAFNQHPLKIDDIQQLKALPQDLPEGFPGAGIGRKLTLEKPVSFEDALRMVKQHVRLERVRVARPLQVKQIQHIGLCAGSGVSLMRLVPHGTFDLILTGEMSHHDTLDFVQNGSYVILCEHSNTERGFLREFKGVLEEELHLEVEVSTVDRDPLNVE